MSRITDIYLRGAPDNVESSFARKRAESLEENHARIRLVDNCKRGKLGSTHAHITRDRVCRVKFEVGKSCRARSPRSNDQIVLLATGERALSSPVVV